MPVSAPTERKCLAMRRLIAAITLAVAALTGAAVVHPAHPAALAEILCCYSR